MMSLMITLGGLGVVFAILAYFIRTFIYIAISLVIIALLVGLGLITKVETAFISSFLFAVVLKFYAYHYAKEDPNDHVDIVFSQDLIGSFLIAETPIDCESGRINFNGSIIPARCKGKEKIHPGMEFEILDVYEGFALVRAHSSANTDEK